MQPGIYRRRLQVPTTIRQPLHCRPKVATIDPDVPPWRAVVPVAGQSHQDRRRDSGARRDDSLLISPRRSNTFDFLFHS